MSLAMGLCDARRRPASVVPPAAPVATSAAPIGFDGFQANWNASAGATSYRLDVATDSGFSSIVLNDFTVSDTNYFFDDVSSRTVYYYRVRAVGPGGISGNSNTISAEVLSSLLDNIQSYWKFDEATFGQRADSVGSHPLDENGNVFPTTGKIGNALQLTGGGNLIQSDVGFFRLSGSGHDFTLAFWMLDPGNSNATVCGLWDEFDVSGSQWRLCCDGSQTGFRFCDSGGQNAIAGGVSNSGDGYDFVVMTWNEAAQEMAIYGGASEVVRETVEDMIQNPSAYFNLGNDTEGTTGFGGQIDEMGIWHRILGQSEIDELYNGGNGRQYPFP